VSHLHAVPDTPLEQRIAATLEEARRTWAALGAGFLRWELLDDDTARFDHARKLEARATELSIIFDELALMVEKREEQ